MKVLIMLYNMESRSSSRNNKYYCTRAITLQTIIYHKQKKSFLLYFYEATE